jgi:PRTRC genetic system protein B
MSLLYADYTTHNAERASISPRQAFVLADLVAGNTRGTVITEHGIEAGNGKALGIGPGRLIDGPSLAGVLASFTADTDGWLPPAVFYRSRARFAWHLPAAVRPMAFTIDGQRTDLRVPWPNLVLIARDTGELQVLALASGQTPYRLARVFHAPLMNLSARGELCFGSATRPPFALESIGAYEDALLRSRFTHVNHPRTVADDTDTNTEEHLAIWRYIQDERYLDLPDELLHPMRNFQRDQLTLQDVLAQ